jgi:hypothetical protein
MKRIVLAVLMCSMVAVMAPHAMAASVHLKSKPALKLTDQGITLNATGALTGLGNGDIVVTLTATGQPTSTCTNPAGATQPPGQNPAEVTLTGAQAIPGSSIKNGNVAFNVSTSAPESPIPGAPDCPNSGWTEDITDVAFTSAMLTVYQPCTDTSPPIDCTVVFTKVVL